MSSSYWPKWRSTASTRTSPSRCKAGLCHDDSDSKGKQAADPALQVDRCGGFLDRRAGAVVGVPAVSGGFHGEDAVDDDVVAGGLGDGSRCEGHLSKPTA